MTKVVYSACYGGFSLSTYALYRYADIKGIPRDSLITSRGCDLDRTDPALVQVVEELKDEANGHHANLKIRDIPPGSLYRIDEYDGAEVVVLQDEYIWRKA
jgi:hypothetical protein